MLDSKKHNHYLKIIKNLKYSSQDHWDVFDDLFYKKISNFEFMKTFRSNGLSNMLETGLPSQEREAALRGKNYNVNYSPNEIKEIISRFEELAIMLGDDINVIQFDNQVGTPRRYIHTHDGQEYLLNFDDLYHVYSAWQIKRSIELLFDNKEIKNILEIGGGYGNLANKVKNLFKNTKYIIVDLPEVLLMQHYYLAKNNPTYKIVNLLDEENISEFNLEQVDCDIILVPYHKYEQLNVNYDVVINTRSFGEMPKKVLKNYFDWIQKNINQNGIFYTTNRYVFTKSKDKNKVREYPFDNYWDVIISQPQWLQTHLHEFLLFRRKEINKIPIQFLLKSFPISTPPPGPIMVEIQTQSEWLKYQKGD